MGGYFIPGSGGSGAGFFPYPSVEERLARIEALLVRLVDMMERRAPITDALKPRDDR